MNLFDLVNRADRAVAHEGVPAQARPLTTAAGHQRCVTLMPNSLLRIVDAHELTSLHILSASLGWALHVQAGTSPSLHLTVCIEQPTAMRVPVPVRWGPGTVDTVELRFDWPQSMVLAGPFDLELTIDGGTPVDLLVGPLVNMREHLLVLARGRGIEVGPGLRPQVLPAANVDVSYIEQEDPREWLNLYNKTGERPPLPPQDVLARYVRSSAVVLGGIEPGSLDFIFSNHVFEHLPNPMQVITNWLSALKPGGVVLGVIPDPRFTFDCRQPATMTFEALQEEAVGGHDVGLIKYQRWCRYTEPRHRPEDLIKRNYSIHVNFFTPATFRDTVAVFESRGAIDRVFVYTATNHKDFAFALRKAV